MAIRRARPPRRLRQHLRTPEPREADAFFDYVASAGAGAEAQISAVEAPFALGERAMVVNYSILDPEAGETRPRVLRLLPG